MSATPITVTAVNRVPMSAFLAQPASAAIDAASGNAIAVPIADWDRILLEFTNTSAGAKSVTIKGAGGLSDALMPDLVQSLAANEVRYAHVNKLHFRQGDGTILVNYSAGMSGTVRGFVLPTPTPNQV